MSCEIFYDVEQNTPRWLELRLGIPTASSFSAVMAKGQGNTRRKYMFQLAGEIITGEPAEVFTNAHMERGHEMEPDARAAYEFMFDHDVRQVGFIRNGRAGASPDGLVGDVGMLEIKTKLPQRLLEAMFREDAPPEHMAQCQGQLWIAEREWLDLVCYWFGMPLVTHRIVRDEPHINRLRTAVDAFNEELDAVVARAKAYNEPDAVREAFRASVSDAADSLGAK